MIISTLIPPLTNIAIHCNDRRGIICIQPKSKPSSQKVERFEYPVTAVIRISIIFQNYGRLSATGVSSQIPLQYHRSPSDTRGWEDVNDRCLITIHDRNIEVMSNGIGSIRGLDGKKINIIGVAILWYFKIRWASKAQESRGNIQIEEGLVSSTT